MKSTMAGTKKTAADPPSADDHADVDDKYSKARRNSKWLPVVIILITGLALGLGSFLWRSRGHDYMIRRPLPSDKTVPPPPPDLAFLEQEYAQLDTKVREIKATGIIMETDANSLLWTKRLQDAARRLIIAKYGNHEHYRVKVDVEFPSSVPDTEQSKGPRGSIIIEMAPISLIPVSVWTFLEIARSWQSGAFHRNAGHVLQATTNAQAITKHLPFQEYNEKFPHAKYTCGYCGRPSGPCWYISIQDNTRNHGPGSQQEKNQYEADANFGTIVSGMNDVVPRIHSVPQNGWLDQKNQILIKTMTVLVPTGPNGGWEEWKNGPLQVQ
jgi:hypothetical protein